MLARHRDHPAYKGKKDFSQMGHYAIGTADLIHASVLDKKYHSDPWEGSAQKPMLYFAKGGEVPPPEHDTGIGHRRTLAEVNKLDFSTYK